MMHVSHLQQTATYMSMAEMFLFSNQDIFSATLFNVVPAVRFFLYLEFFLPVPQQTLVQQQFFVYIYGYHAVWSISYEHLNEKKIHCVE